MTTIKHPEWCNYPDAAVPLLGCWSLLAGMVESEGYCKKCELYKKITMATIKMCTDIPQSKVLANILPLESADMYYALSEDESMNIIYFGKPQGFFDKTQVAWSLAALLGVLPYPQLSKDKLGSGKVGWLVSVYPNDCRYDSCWHDNPIDACVVMIERLNELNLL